MKIRCHPRIGVQTFQLSPRLLRQSGETALKVKVSPARIENSLSPLYRGTDFSDSMGAGAGAAARSGVAANPLTVNQIRQQPSAKSDTRLLFYSADLQHVVRHGSHGIHSPIPIPIPISPQSLYLMPPSATQSHQICHGAATELPQSHHGAAMDPTASSHLIPISPQSLYLMPPSATQSYQSCHGAATEPPQSCHGSHGIIPSPFPSPHTRST